VNSVFILFWIFKNKLLILVLGIGSAEVGERQTLCCMSGLLDFDILEK